MLYKKKDLKKQKNYSKLKVSLTVRFDIKAKWFINRLSINRKQGQKLSIRT